MPRRRRDVGASVGQVVMWMLFVALLVPAGFAGWAIGHYTHVGGARASAAKTVTVTSTATVTTTAAAPTTATTAAATTAPPATTAPATTAAAAAGNPAKGKQLFTAQGCGSCHTFKPAGSTGSIGPDLDTAPEADAKKAGQPLAAFVRESIVKPDAYVPSGYQPGIMPGTFGQSLSSSQIDDLVAFLTQSGG